jgi:hypothetical protein
MPFSRDANRYHHSSIRELDGMPTKGDRVIT